MIGAAEVRERARGCPLREHVVQKDYVLGWFLWAIPTDQPAALGPSSSVPTAAGSSGGVTPGVVKNKMKGDSHFDCPAVLAHVAAVVRRIQARRRLDTQRAKLGCVANARPRGRRLWCPPSKVTHWRSGVGDAPEYPNPADARPRDTSGLNSDGSVLRKCWRRHNNENRCDEGSHRRLPPTDDLSIS